MKKGLGVMLVLLLAGTSAFAAGGQTINVLVEPGGFMQQQEIAKQYEGSTGNKVNFINVPYDSLYDKLTAEMAAGGSTYDVVTLPGEWIPRFASFLLPFDTFFTSQVKSDLFPALIAEANYNGNYIGVPAWANCQILFYRKDLFQDPNEKAAFKKKYGYELKPPTNWQQFIDAAVFFTRKDASGNPVLYGTDVKGAAQGIDCEYPLHVLQAGSPGIVLDSAGKIIVDNPAHIKALKFYADLHLKYHVSPPSVMEIDWAVAQQLFYQGKTAMTRFWGHAYRMVPADSKVAGKVGAAPMIAGDAGIASVPGSYYNTIPKTTKNLDVARQFVQFAYEKNALQLGSPLGLVSRKSALAANFDKPGFEHLRALSDTLSARQTKTRPAVENWEEINREVLVPMVQDVLSGNKTAEDAVKWARAKLEGMTSK
jgi:ABC-type glycerol-3-phosphate transport system substrate-binding protein